MRWSRLYYRHTRRGRVQRVARERYLRDDIGCLSELCPLQAGPEADHHEVYGSGEAFIGLNGDDFTSSNDDLPPGTGGVSSGGSSSASSQKLLSSRPKGKRYVVLDTNVCLKQLDMLELDCDALRDVVVPQTVVEEVRHRNVAAWSRLKSLLASQSRRFVFFPNTCHRQTYTSKRPGESANDYNDRCIRLVCRYYDSCVGRFGIRAVLLSDDRECRRLALEEGIETLSSKQFVDKHRKDWPRLADLLVHGGDPRDDALHGASAQRGRGAGAVKSPSAEAGRRRTTRFEPHLTPVQLEAGLRGGGLLAGTFRVNRECWFEGKVTARVGAQAAQQAAQQAARSGAEERRNVLTGQSQTLSSSSSSPAGGPSRSAGGGCLSDRLAEAWLQSRQKPGGSVPSGQKQQLSAVQVLVHGARDVNRATDGDQVVLQLLPVLQWRQPSRKIAVAPATGIEQQASKRESDTAIHTNNPTKTSAQPFSVSQMAAAIKGGLQPTARVVGVLRRAWRPLCGSIEEESTAADGDGAARDGATASVVFVPVDPRFPRARVRTTQAGSLAGQRIVVGLDGWKCTSAFPDGHLVRVIGPTGDRQTETEVLLLEHDIPSNDFSAEVMACLPPPTWSADEEFPREQSKGRVDCRGLTVCSIDPPGCKDIDDALHARELWLTRAEAQEGVDASVPTVQLWRPGCPQEARGHFASQAARDMCRLPVSAIPSGKRASVGLAGSVAGSQQLIRYLELGVHIADVTHFVEHGTPIDVEAAKRGNTTYLTERRLDMLPKLLTETLCSLRDDGPRFSFSVTWLAEVEPVSGGLADAACDRFESSSGAGNSGESDTSELPEFLYSVVRTCFHKSLVLSKKAMTYQQAFDRLVAERSRIRRDRCSLQHGSVRAGSGGGVRRADPIDQGVAWIADVARFLRRKRIEAGALTLASPEVRFLLDSETHEPITVQAYQHKETNRTVEEFMLWANISVAAKTTEVYPRCAVLRRHPAPQPGAFDGLVAAARSVGLALETSTSKALATSLDEAVSEDNPWLNKILRILATRCMQQAVYFPSGECSPAQYLHYGLATPIYTHFTSPIRRYADVMVHRLLSGCIEQGILPHEYEDRQWMRRVTSNLNTRHYNSQIAGRASAALFTQIFFTGTPREEDALVLRVRRNGIVVLVPSYGLEGTVMLVCPKKLRGTEAGRRWAVQEDSQLQLSADATSLEYTPTVSGSSGASGGAASGEGEGGDGEQVTIRLFDKVRILLSVEERDRARQRHELTYRLVDPPLHQRDGGLSADGSKPLGAVGTKRLGASRDIPGGADSDKLTGGHVEDEPPLAASSSRSTVAESSTPKGKGRKRRRTK